MAHGRADGRGELCPFESYERGGGAAQAVGWGQGLFRDYQQAVLLGGRHCKGEGVLHWKYG